MPRLMPALRRAAAVGLIITAVARVLRGGWVIPISRYAVEGPSMEPTYRAGDRVLVNRLAYLFRAPAPGDVVVLRDPERAGHYLLKRVATAPDGRDQGPSGLWVLGDNAADSRDSRGFGAVARGALVGRAWLRY